MKDIGIIGSADGPTSIFVSSDSEDFLKSGGIIEENNDAQNEVIDEEVVEVVETRDVNEILNERTIEENLDAGLKIMGLGMIAVFAVLTVLYIIVKIMGLFAKGKNNNEKN